MGKLRLAAAVSLVLASQGAFGLGLGDIEMRSALNQPMNAEIRLTSVKPGELDGMIVKLASADAFSRAGIERSQSLQDLRFSVDQSGPTPVIRITSAGPVVEPFLNFLLEVDWPQGRMVREYTVLLDPPVFLSPSSTSGGASVGDSPALTNRNDNALVAPARIDREASNASVVDGFEVELVGAGAEIANDTAIENIGGGIGADEGEVVSLDELGGLSDEPLNGSEGEVVSLTDLAAPNVAAEEARDVAAQSAEDYDFEVEVVGSATEVGNDVPGSDDIVNAGVSGDASDGEIVSLDSLDPNAIASSDTASVSAGGALSGPTSDESLTVQQGDTLYEIAESIAADGVSVQQMMLALLSANESSFIDGNINLVRAGSILRVPSASDANTVSQAEAIAAVASQNQLWQEYRDNARRSQGTRLASDARGDASGSGAGSAAELADNGVVEASTDDAEATEADVLSADARAILEQARQEILERDELRILGEDSSSSVAANVGDARDGSGAVADIDRRLQLAREELSSSRLEVQELGDQAGELSSTSDNLDALVALRQNEIAALEQRLADAREAESAAESSLENAAANVSDAVADAAADAGDAASDALAGAGDLAAGAVAGAGDAVDAAAEGAGDAVDATRNALSDTGQELADVELVDETVDTASGALSDAEQAAADAAAAAGNASQADQPWYQSLLSDPRKLGIAGVGGLALLGALGTLLWRRRKTDDDAMFDFDEDDVEFLDEDGFAADAGGAVASAGDAVGDAAGKIGEKFSAGGAAVAAAGTAGVAGIAGAASKLKGDDDKVADFDTDSFDELDAAVGGATEESLDKDDTISEIDVYLAYGLHGQAEELLTDAMTSDPNNPVYPKKLLDTYHAQGNGEGFATVAADYHTRFGGNDAPQWDEVVAMGHELRPQDALFAGGAAAVASMGARGAAGGAMSDDDFAGMASGDGAASSISRDFGEADESLDFGSSAASDLGDETDLMDQSLDPAFAFDEGDLEATGDFSQIADEMAAESADGVIEFAAFDEPATESAPKAAAASAMDGIEAPDLDSLGLSSSASATNDQLDDVATNLSDDLTLDLDQLSGDMSLEGSELLDGGELGSVESLEIPDLTADNELLTDGDLGAVGADADEMDTMMDLAKAYIDMGDKDSASNALGEIVKSGSPDQVSEAETLLRKIS